MVAHACNLSTGEVKRGRSQVEALPRFHSKTFSQKIILKKNEIKTKCVRNKL
jgi:hypothetical protein